MSASTSRARVRKGGRARLPEASACASCARPFGMIRAGASLAGGETARASAETRVERRFGSASGPVCRACYQRAYRARAREARRCETCGGAGDDAWRWRARDDGGRARVCRACDDAAARRAAVDGDGGEGEDAEGGRCARCAKAGPGSAKNFWYRAESEAMRGERVCKQCHLLDYRERMNADPRVFCSGCGKTELRARHWRKRAGGGHWCDACYKTDRLRRMNDDPSVFCVTCGSLTSGPPEWRRKGDGYLCRSCLSEERSAQRKNAHERQLARVGSLAAPV